jgi:hypothetical protein
MSLVLLWLGCGGGGPTVAGTPLLDVPVVPPWSGWSLPLDGARVVANDAGLIAAHYGPDRVAELGASWRSALVAAGFVETLDHSEGGLVGVRFEQGGNPHTVLELSVMPLPDATVVSAVLVSIRAEPEPAE